MQILLSEFCDLLEKKDDVSVPNMYTFAFPRTLVFSSFSITLLILYRNKMLKKRLKWYFSHLEFHCKQYITTAQKCKDSCQGAVGFLNAFPASVPMCMNQP